MHEIPKSDFVTSVLEGKLSYNQVGFQANAHALSQSKRRRVESGQSAGELRTSVKNSFQIKSKSEPYQKIKNQLYASMKKSGVGIWVKKPEEIEDFFPKKSSLKTETKMEN